MTIVFGSLVVKLLCNYVALLPCANSDWKIELTRCGIDAGCISAQIIPHNDRVSTANLFSAHPSVASRDVYFLPVEHELIQTIQPTRSLYVV